MHAMKTPLKPIKAKTILLLLFGISAFSCAKDKIGTTRYVEGKVLEYGTEKAVANARVLLLEARGEFLGPSYKVIVDSTFTDEKGYYRFQYIKYPGSNFVSAADDQYFKSEDYYVLDQKKSKTDIYLDPHAWVKVKVVHEGPIGEYDRISMRYQTCTPEFIHIMEKETEIICMKPSNREHEFEYLKTPTSQAGERIKFSQYLPGHDTTEYVIQF